MEPHLSDTGSIPTQLYDSLVTSQTATSHSSSTLQKKLYIILHIMGGNAE